MAVLITGASSGVGALAAERFARAGHDVALTARSVQGLQAVAARVRAHGARAVVCPADLTDRTAVQHAVDTATDDLGRLDVLVLSHAITVFGPFREVEPEDFDRVIAVTALGAVNAVRAALPALTESRGVIVSVGSLNGRVPLPQWNSYSAAKHAQRGFLNTLEVELRASGSPVSVAQLLPGAINTPVWSRTPTATGRLPRRPPEAYDPKWVADAAYRLSVDPKPEQWFGGEALALGHLWTQVRPVGDLVFGIMYRYLQTGRRPGSRDGLRATTSDGDPRGAILQRPSLTDALRRRLRR